MEFEDYLGAVDDAFRLHAEGKVIETGLLHAMPAKASITSRLVAFISTGRSSA
jgi:hypothetical protein